MRPSLLSLLIAGFFAYAGTAKAIDPWAPKLSTNTTSSDHGGVGLWQMPSARMAPDGEFAVQMSRVDAYDRYSFALQALKNFEFVFRYNSLNNQLYGPKDFSGNLTLKDRAFDAKLSLVDEGNWMPALAVGARDFLGTGLFSSEYLVASKRYYNWDITAGLMWGNIGSRTDLSNPFIILSSRFEGDRVNTGSVGGEANSNTWFKGKHASLFAGVSYQLPNQPLWIMAEYDANNYQKEPRSTQFNANSPVNVGVKYRYNDWLDVGLSYQRGDTIGLNIGIRTNFMDKSAPIPKMEPPIQPPVQATIVPVLQQQVNQPELTSAEPAKEAASLTVLRQQLQSVGVNPMALSWNEESRTLIVALHNQRHRSLSRAIGRASRVLLAHTDAQVWAFQFRLLNGDGLATDEVKLMRHQLVQVMNKQLSPAVVSRYVERVNTSLTPAALANDAATPQSEARELPSVKTQTYPYWTASLSPAMRHNIGGPDDFYQFQLMMVAPLELKIRPGLSLSSSFTANVYNTFDKLTLESDSKLPKVRSDIKNYLQQQGAVSLTSFQADYLTQLGANSYGRVSGGLFEEMFGGVGGEFLYAPAGKRWAVGVDAYWVKQREFDQKFDFRDYQANTGHATWYHQWPWFNINSKLSVGQYLAGDRGYTLDVSRVFDNGVTVGGFFTRTNVSAAEFGEGSFDKGIYISIPLDFMTTRYTSNSFGMVWKPLTRDGGAMLHNSKRLYPTVRSGRADDLFNGAADLAD